MTRRTSLRAIAIVLLVARPASAHEVEAALALGPQYAWLGGDAQLGLLDDQLHLGAGFTATSDYHFTRAGLRASAGADLDRGALSLAFGYAPPQRGRGWMELEPEVSLRHSLGVLHADWTARAAARAVDVTSSGAGASIETIHELRLELELELARGDVLRVSLLGDLALYDHDLGLASLRGSDMGPLIAIGGHPERYAVRAQVELRCAEQVRLRAGFGGLAFAGSRGGGLLPQLGVIFGPVAGAHVGATLEPLVPVGTSEPARLSFHLEVAWER